MEAPDPIRLSQAFSTISEECSKLPNLPAFNQGANILNAVTQLAERVEQIATQMQQMQTQMQTQMQQMQTQMQTQMQQMQQRSDDRFDSLERRITALNQNSIARTQNSMAAFSDRELTALINIITAENIPEFPKTGATLGRMSNTAVNQVLSALGLSTDGLLENKRNRLRVAIGLKIDGI